MKKIIFIFLIFCSCSTIQENFKQNEIKSLDTNQKSTTIFYHKDGSIEKKEIVDTEIIEVTKTNKEYKEIVTKKKIYYWLFLVGIVAGFLGFIYIKKSLWR